MTLPVTLCAEDSLAAEVVSFLLDRVVAERASQPWLRELWADRETLDAQRMIVDLDQSPGWSDRTHLKAVEDRGRRRVHPRQVDTNRPLVGNAAIAYKCVRLASENAQALVLAFDTDHRVEPERCRAGIDAAFRGVERRLVVVIAEAHPEFDAWVIAGFVPSSQRDHDAVASLRATLRSAGHSFDPIAEPHRLTSTVAHDPRDAKSVCQRLLGLHQQAHMGEPAVRQCIARVSLDAPISQAIGLRAFVDELEHGLLPLFGDSPRRDR